MLMLYQHSNDSLRPVTIKQLIESVQPYPDADFKVDGNSLNEVCASSPPRS